MDIQHTTTKILLLLTILSWASTGRAGQPLETESARLLPAKVFVLENTFEYQTSSEGTEATFPMLFEYGLTNRLELAFEPIIQTAIRPKLGRRATGIGDIEVTTTYLLFTESQRWPAFALAAEMKIPVAKDRLIGTGKADYAAYAIVSRRFSKLDAHANVGYTILGKPAGVSLNNIFSFAVAGEYRANLRWDIVGEVFANTVAAPGEGDQSQVQSANEQTAELAGGEAFGMLGMRYHASRSLTLAIGLVYDNNNAVMLRPGISLEL